MFLFVPAFINDIALMTGTVHTLPLALFPTP